MHGDDAVLLGHSESKSDKFRMLWGIAEVLDDFFCLLWRAEGVLEKEDEKPRAHTGLIFNFRQNPSCSFPKSLLLIPPPHGLFVGHLFHRRRSTLQSRMGGEGLLTATHFVLSYCSTFFIQLYPLSWSQALHRASKIDSPSKGQSETEHITIWGTALHFLRPHKTMYQTDT